MKRALAVMLMLTAPIHQNPKTEFVADVLKAVDAPVTRENVAALLSWSQREGGHATNNPLNSTRPADGATEYNAIGVKNYPTREIGIIKTADTLRSYPSIHHALQHNDQTALFAAPGWRTWSGGAYTGRDVANIYARVLPTVPEPTPTPEPVSAKTDIARASKSQTVRTPIRFASNPSVPVDGFPLWFGGGIITTGTIWALTRKRWAAGSVIAGLGVAVIVTAGHRALDESGKHVGDSLYGAFQAFGRSVPMVIAAAIGAAGILGVLAAGAAWDGKTQIKMVFGSFKPIISFAILFVETFGVRISRWLLIPTAALSICAIGSQQPIVTATACCTAAAAYQIHVGMTKRNQTNVVR